MSFIHSFHSRLITSTQIDGLMTDTGFNEKQIKPYPKQQQQQKKTNNTVAEGFRQQQQQKEEEVHSIVDIESTDNNRGY